jgi:hypothetical protein
MPNTPFIKGRWVENVFVPDVLREELQGWEHEVAFIAAQFPNTPFFISSIKSNMYGQPRKELSHKKGALDMAAMHTVDMAISPDGQSPRLAEKLPLLAHLANNIPSTFPAIGVEGDHLHLDHTLRRGVYSYPTYREGVYVGDAGRNKSVVANVPFFVGKDGSLTKMPLYRSVGADGFYVFQS